MTAGRFKSDKCLYYIESNSIQEISLAAVQETLDYETWNDDSEFIEGGFDKGRTVQEFICEDGYAIPEHLIEVMKNTLVKR